MVLYDFLKRICDLLAAAIVLVAGLPFIIIVLAVMLILDGRPLFFRQSRAGRNGSPIRILKLRTIQTAHDPLNPAEHVTRSGRLLRRFGIDELPQIINIIKGEMSFVGPRPILLTEAENYDSIQMKRLGVLPGITGWAQVNGRNSLGWQERIDLDLWYVENRSFFLDLVILLKTPLALLSSEGVYGPGNLDPSKDDFQNLRATDSLK